MAQGEAFAVQVWGLQLKSDHVKSHVVMLSLDPSIGNSSGRPGMQDTRFPLPVAAHSGHTLYTARIQHRQIKKMVGFSDSTTS